MERVGKDERGVADAVVVSAEAHLREVPQVIRAEVEPRVVRPLAQQHERAERDDQSERDEQRRVGLSPQSVPGPRAHGEHEEHGGRDADHEPAIGVCPHDAQEDAFAHEQGHGEAEAGRQASEQTAGCRECDRGQQRQRDERKLRTCEHQPEPNCYKARDGEQARAGSDFVSQAPIVARRRSFDVNP